MKVWTYWEGPQFSYIEVCLESIAFHCRGLDYQHVTPENLDSFLPDGILCDGWKTLGYPAQRADCIRAALLFSHGGLWIDADTLMLAPPLVEEHADCCHLRWTNPPDRIPNGYIYCRPHSKVAEAWLAGVNYAISHPYEFSWTDIGEKILTPIINGMPAGECHQWDLAVWQPIEVDKDVSMFFTPLEWAAFLQPWTVAFGLNHSCMIANWNKAMLVAPRLWRTSPILIHRLLAHVSETLKVAA